MTTCVCGRVGRARRLDVTLIAAGWRKHPRLLAGAAAGATVTHGHKSGRRGVCVCITLLSEAGRHRPWRWGKDYFTGASLGVATLREGFKGQVWGQFGKWFDLRGQFRAKGPS